MSLWEPDVAVVSAPTAIVGQKGLAAEIEAAFVNSFHVRCTLGLNAMGVSFVFGKAQLWSRSALEQTKALDAMASNMGDDVMARKAVKASGLKAKLALPVNHDVGRRTFRAVWQRQLRWVMMVLRPTPMNYAAQLLAGNILPFAWMALLATFNFVPWWSLPLFIGSYYAMEFALTLAAGWRLSWWSPVAWAARDLLFPVLWTVGLFRRQTTWRGNVVADGHQQLA